MADPNPGDFAVVPSRDMVGRLIRVGQWLNGDGFADYEHAFLYLGGGVVLEAAAAGSRIADLAEYPPDWPAWYRCDPNAGPEIVKQAYQMIGIPYSYADYFAIAAHRFRIPAPGLKAFVASTGHMICSQLVDEVYRRAGVHLFQDGRWPGYVTPADLYSLIAAQRADERV